MDGLSEILPPDSSNNPTADIDLRGSNILSLAQGYPNFRYATVMIGRSPSLPLSALDLAHQHSQGGQCLSCIVHRHTPRLKPPTCIPLFRMLILIAPCPRPWIPKSLPRRSGLAETLPEEVAQGVISSLGAPLRSRTSLGTTRYPTCHADVA